MSSEESEVWKVAELTREIRSLLEEQIGTVWVEGEISNLRRQASGHCYFTLKDDAAQIACVMFRGLAVRSTVQPRDGEAVRVLGELSVYEPRGSYQLVVKQIKAQGQGSLQARFEALKQKLFEEGLFDEARKQPIPRYPELVVLVTSPTGAAVRDMLQVLGRRAPWVRVLIYPVRVQGQGAEKEIAAAIQRINDWAALGIPRPDTIVVGRGGGSLEDLWNFNEEVVARAIAASALPVISAVGHEIDFSIADFVADLRAPTPSAAAELLSPDGDELRQRLTGAQQRLSHRLESRLRQLQQVMDLMARGALLHTPMRHLQRCEQALDEGENAICEVVRARLQGLKDDWQVRRDRLGRLHPATLVAAAGHRLAMREQALQQAMKQALSGLEEVLKAHAASLRALGPESVLARGFSYTRTESGELLRDAAEVRPGDRMRTRLAQGEVVSIVVDEA